MAKEYEIELRGLLNNNQKKKLLEFLNSKGKKVKQYERTQWIFDKSHDKKIDFRIKQTNGETEFSLKVGKLSDSNRREISIPFPKESLSEAMDFAKTMGYRDGLIAKRNAKIYYYKGVEWAVVDVPSHSSYFEAEIIANTKAKGKSAEKNIRQVADELNLEIFTKEKLMKYIKKLDTEANREFKL